MKFINSLILKLKILVSKVIFLSKNFLPTVSYIKSQKANKKIILLEMPTYTNLGDQAIAYAQREFFKKYFPDYGIIEVIGQYYGVYKRFIKKSLTQDDIIVSIGGGNFGDEYNSIEVRRKKSIKTFKDNRFFVFPQTIYYSDSKRGKEFLESMKEAIKENKNLTIFAREQMSFDFAKSNFDVNVILAPDIVLSLDKQAPIESRNDTVLCLRNDVEKKVLLSERAIKHISDNSTNVIFTDTFLTKSVPLSQWKDVLESKWQEFRKAKVVITDRLHGMIFSVITATPCIVLPNYNYKVESFYNTWLRDTDYVFFANDETEVIDLFDSIKDKEYLKEDFDSYFDQLANIIKKQGDSIEHKR